MTTHGGHADDRRRQTERELRRELQRVIERLRALGPVRLAAAHPGGGSVADAAHRLAQHLADAAAAHEPQPARAVPRLADHAAADQIEVLARDLTAVAASAPDAELLGLVTAVAEFRRQL